MAFGDIVLLHERTPRGPFTRRQIQEGLSRGEFTARDLAHTPGLKDWLPLLEVLHHLDREVVHWPRSREGRDLPPLPDSFEAGKDVTFVKTTEPALPPLPLKGVEQEFAIAPQPAPSSGDLKQFVHDARPAGQPPILIIPGPSARPPSLPTRAPSPIAARFNAFLIDVAVLFIPVLVVFAISYGSWYARGALESRTPQAALEERAWYYRELWNLVLLVANGFAWLYAAGLESSPWQGTIGKQLMGLIVTDEAGCRISFLRATGRHAAKYLSALPLFLGFMAALFNPQRLTWHDRMAGTRVAKR